MVDIQSPFNFSTVLRYYYKNQVGMWGGGKSVSLQVNFVNKNADPLNTIITAVGIPHMKCAASHKRTCYFGLCRCTSTKRKRAGWSGMYIKGRAE